MADPNAESTQLTESQQDALATYLSVTDQEPEAAIPLLQRSQWNVQIAIAKFFDGEAPDPVEEARAAQAATPPPPPPQAGRREVLLNGSPEFPSSSRTSSREPAPRIVAQPENRGVYKPPFIITLLFTPVSLLYKLLSTSLGLFSYIFPFLPRLLTSLSSRSPSRSIRLNTTGRRPLNPRDTAARFIREFSEIYGTEHALPFYENGYASAFDTAKSTLKFLLVILLSPEHDDTETFVRDILLSSQFSSFLQSQKSQSDNLILWAGTVQDSEAYQVSIGLNCSIFPFAALIAHTPQDSSTAMSTILRLSGLQPAGSFVSKLRTAIASHTPLLETARASRRSQEAARDLRREQESAYERSLAQDRERMRIRREAEEAKREEERQQRQKALAKEWVAKKKREWRIWRRGRLGPEPDSNVKEATRLSIRMPNGERVVRRFEREVGVEEVYAFVECFGVDKEEDMEGMGGEGNEIKKPAGYEHVYGFKLVSPMPRVVYEVGDGGTVGERIGRSGNLIVEMIEEEDDDEEEEGGGGEE